MAKVIPSALIDGLKGSLGGSTFRTNKSGIHVYTQPKPRNPATEYQVASRNAINAVAGSWSGLTDVQKSLWNRFASQSPDFISGFNAFSSLNANIINANYSGLSCVMNPPTTVYTPSAMWGVFANEAGGTSTDLFWWFPEDIYTWCKLYVSKVTGSARSWRRFDTVHAPVGVGNHNYNYPAGTLVQFRARGMSGSGRQGPYVYTPVLELPIYTLIATDSGNHRLKIIYSNPMTFAADRYSLDSCWPRFTTPYGIHFSGDYIYVADFGQDILFQFHRSTFRLNQIYNNSGKAAALQLNEPKNVVELDYGLVVISKDNTLLLLDPSDFSLLNYYISPVGVDPIFLNFRDLCFFDTNEFLIVSSAVPVGFSHFSIVFSAIPVPHYTITYIASYGSGGSGDGQFDSPHGIHFDGNYIYVCDTLNDRISVWTADPIAFDHHITSLTGDPKSFNHPIAIDSDDDYIYLSDFLNYRIVKFTKGSYEYVSEFGSIGTGNEEMNGCYGLVAWRE